MGVAAEHTRRKVQLFSRLEVVVIDVNQILGAIDLARLHKLPSGTRRSVLSTFDSLRAPLRSLQQTLQCGLQPPIRR